MYLDDYAQDQIMIIKTMTED